MICETRGSSFSNTQPISNWEQKDELSFQLFMDDEKMVHLINRGLNQT